MARSKVNFDTVRSIALSLPGVEESTTYGSPCFKARGKLLTCIAIHRSAEPDTLAVRVDSGSRAEMIADDPDVYYLTDHYVNYPFVLVRMNRIQAGELRDLLGTAWRLAATKPPARKRATQSKPTRESMPKQAMPKQGPRSRAKQPRRTT
jgi:hypothetical protein